MDFDQTVIGFGQFWPGFGRHRADFPALRTIWVKLGAAMGGGNIFKNRVWCPFDLGSPEGLADRISRPSTWRDMAWAEAHPGRGRKVGPA